MTTLEDFYYGNIIPHEIPIIKGSEYDTANRLVVRHDEALTATLTEQQKETFQKFKDNYLELLTLGERDVFIRGFLSASKSRLRHLTTAKSDAPCFALFRAKQKNRGSTRPHRTKPTQPICRGLWGAKSSA